MHEEPLTFFFWNNKYIFVELRVCCQQYRFKPKKQFVLSWEKENLLWLLGYVCIDCLGQWAVVEHTKFKHAGMLLRHSVQALLTVECQKGNRAYQVEVNAVLMDSVWSWNIV